MPICYISKLRLTLKKKKKEKAEYSRFVLLHSCIHWSAVVSIMCLNEAIVQRQFIFISAPWKIEAGEEVKPRNLTSKTTTNVGLQINVLPGSLGGFTCKIHRSSCEEPIPQGKALPPPPDLILFPSRKILHFLSCLSLLSAATKGRLAAFTKHDKHEAARVRRLFPPGPHFTRTITCFSDQSPSRQLRGRGCRVSDPPHRLPSQSKQTAGWRDRKGDKHHIHVNTCTCILRLRRAKHGGRHFSSLKSSQELTHLSTASEQKHFFFLSNQPKCRKRTVFTVPQLCQNLKLQNSPSHTFSPFVSQLQLKDKMTQKWKFYYNLLPLKLMGSRVKFQEKAATRFHREAPETSPHFPAACRQAERTITEFIL